MYLKNHDTTICCMQQAHLRFKDIRKIKVKEWKTYYMQSVTEKELNWLY